MCRISVRAKSRRPSLRPARLPSRFALEELERRESPTDLLNVAAGIGVAASLYAVLELGRHTG